MKARVYTGEGLYSSGPVNPMFCRARVFSGAPAYKSYQCGRSGVLTEDGYSWCRQHAPSTHQAKAAEQKARRDQERRRRKYLDTTHRLERAVVTAAMDWHLVAGTDDTALIAACEALRTHLRESHDS